jgi:hypothetical protein
MHSAHLSWSDISTSRRPCYPIRQRQTLDLVRHR